ncbi:MAG TPA: glycine betaine ABC transporter substrate-binding protein [Solirubrobacteraceae bacterium]|nr:glycine betaine ABC transporter substrate-binding protein [Solirubrobacteraceae bacterium]
MKHRKLFALLTLFACMISLSLVVAACGDDEDDGAGGDTTAQTQEAAGDQIQSDPENNDVSITVGSKNFTEQKVLGEIYAQALEAAGYRVDTALDLGDEKTAQKALKQGEIDGYPEYTGTALLSLCDVPTDEIPKDPEQAFEETKQCFEKDNLTAFPPTPFTSSNEVAVTQETAERLDLQQISDLKGKAQDLTLYGSPECRQRTDCLLGLKQTYGLGFKRFVPVDIALRHEVLKRGDDVVSIVFTTDPQNKRQNLVLLEDDQGMFPPYNSTFVVRDEIARKAGPDLAQVIEKVQTGLTDEVMQELNARVDLDKQSPEQVAQQYLQESDLVADG